MVRAGRSVFLYGCWFVVAGWLYGCSALPTSTRTSQTDQSPQPAGPAISVPPAAIGSLSIAEEKPSASIPEEIPTLVEENNIFFPLRSTIVDDLGKEKLRQHANRLKLNLKETVTLVGYTDDLGSRNYNLAITEERLNAVGDGYGAPQLGGRVADVDLLRRIVLKRCIYGVDYNEMAVELARLGLWLHSLVPGLPLSYLGANLQYGNSLVGVGGIVPGLGLFAIMREEEAARRAGEVASINDLELGDIARGREIQAELEAATAGLHDFYDTLTAGPLVEEDFRALEIEADQIIEGDLSIGTAAALGRARTAARAQAALHWRLSFPAILCSA